MGKSVILTVLCRLQKHDLSHSIVARRAAFPKHYIMVHCVSSVVTDHSVVTMVKDACSCTKYNII